MLVVQNDRNNSRMTNTILVFITTNLSRAAEPTQVLIDVTTPEGKPSGLKQTSVVSGENILTVVQTDILPRHPHAAGGRCSQGIPGSSLISTRAD